MSVQGVDPRTGQPAGDPVESTSDSAVAEVCAAAAGAFPEWSASRDRPAVLERVADALDAAGADLVATADRETALGAARLSGELLRTTNQLRLFAGVLREGSYLEATIDGPDPDLVPPRPDLRRLLRPLGTVGVFAASNFPFAFSVAGGDTASALAAGCPVVVKAHPGHPRTSLDTFEVVSAALRDAGAPDGVFGVVHGQSAGVALVRHPAVRAVGFTGSTAGGRALFDLACARPDPIPFYGELGSVNPVVVLPDAAAERATELARGYAASLTLGVGQFCTNPGLLFAPESLLDAVAEAVRGATGGPMLTERMRDGYDAGVTGLGSGDLVDVLATGHVASGGFAVTPHVFAVPLADFAANLATLTEEHFGPAGIVVSYTDPAELLAVLPALPGSLTATVHAADTEPDLAARIADALRGIAGRLVYNGWPTGVAVSWAMQHGGPWPATTNPLHTSVGATAIRRWLAPVSYQSWPDALLPPELQDANPLGIPRRVDGALRA